MLNPASARLYAARWALLSHEEKPASSLALSRALLLHLPLWLPRLVLGVFCALLCPHLEAREITDGNVNYSFVVTDRRTGKKLFLKQAEAFLKWQPQLALERDRMRREVQYFRDVAAVLGEQDAARFLPRIYHFDLANTTFVMEYLDGHEVAFDTLFSRGRVCKEAAIGLGEFMGKSHARTLDRGEPGAQARAVEYWNASLRAIQLEHVYTVCFAESARGRALGRDKAVRAEVELLKAKVRG